MRLVAQAKNDRLTQLLQQTESFFTKLGAKVRLQQTKATTKVPSQHRRV